MKLRIYNKTGSNITYLGTIIIPANSFLDIDPIYFNDLEVDPNVRNDLITNQIDISDTVTRYGNNDGIKQLDFMAGLRDSEGKGITSTVVVVGPVTHQALDVNVLGDITFALSPIPASNVKTVIKYNELTMVASGSLEILLSYTVPPATTSLLQRIFVSGENTAIYKVIYNSNTIATKRTYYTYLNEQFEFVQSSNNGFVLEEGDTIEVSVLQNRTTVANFESSLQIIEVS